MKEWQRLSDSELVAETKRCVAREREATLAVIERVREIQRRLLHLEIGYSSLHEFCVVELGYSDGAAYRRIHAMELCEELPQARESIAEGRLSLSNAASLQRYLETEPEKHQSSAARGALFAEIEGKSKRECERIFNPEQTGQEMKLHVDEDTLADLKRLSELLVIPMTDHATLIKKIAKIALKTVDPLQKKASTKSGSADKKLSTSPEKLEQASARRSSKSPRSISAPIKRAIWVRDESMCAFVNTVTGKRCCSRYGLQIDHIVPVALGGRATLENLRLLCFAHNHFEAQRILGLEKMAQYRPI